MEVSEEKEWPEPPAHLSERSKVLWCELVGTRVRGTTRIVLFQIPLEYLDLAGQAREQRMEEGLTSKTKRTGVPHLNPVLRVEQHATQSFLKLWERLGLNREREPKDPFSGIPGVIEM